MQAVNVYNNGLVKYICPNYNTIPGLLYMRDGLLYGEGRIEILNDLDRHIIPICADEGWNMTTADIVCKQVGFEGAYGGKVSGLGHSDFTKPQKRQTTKFMTSAIFQEMLNPNWFILIKLDSKHRCCCCIVVVRPR